MGTNLRERYQVYVKYIDKNIESFQVTGDSVEVINNFLMIRIRENRIGYQRIHKSIGVILNNVAFYEITSIWEEEK